MYTCVICRWDTEFDDVVLAPEGNGRCVCLRCYARETDTERPMPKDLRRDISAALAALPAGWA
ncbi:MAG: hypothetical protein U0531_21330 [Dehalococcoidia bacterium]